MYRDTGREAIAKTNLYSSNTEMHGGKFLLGTCESFLKKMENGWQVFQCIPWRWLTETAPFSDHQTVPVVWAWDLLLLGGLFVFLLVVVLLFCFVLFCSEYHLIS